MIHLNIQATIIRIANCINVIKVTCTAVTFCWTMFFTDNAESYKDEGNSNFKIKKYRWAIANYTEGIKCKSKDKEVNAVLYSNRAAAHFHLGKDTIFCSLEFLKNVGMWKLKRIVPSLCLHVSDGFRISGGGNSGVECANL